MTDKELKRLSRSELLEMLIAQMEENENLKTCLEEMQERADSRQITIERAGSIAEAALALNGVFEAAEAAAAQYLENIRRLSSDQEAVCKQIEADARAKAEAICAKAEKLCIKADAYSRKVRAGADDYSQKTRKEVDLYRKQAEEKIAALFPEKDGMSSLLHPNEEGGPA